MSRRREGNGESRYESQRFGSLLLCCLIGCAKITCHQSRSSDGPSSPRIGLTRSSFPLVTPISYQGIQTSDEYGLVIDLPTILICLCPIFIFDPRSLFPLFHLYLPLSYFISAPISTPYFTFVLSYFLFMLSGSRDHHIAYLVSWS